MNYRSFKIDTQYGRFGENPVFYIVYLIDENKEVQHKLYFQFYRKAVAAGNRWRNQRFVTEENTLDYEYRRFLLDLHGA